MKLAAPVKEAPPPEDDDEDEEEEEIYIDPFLERNFDNQVEM
jgi:hypothetical protein